MSVLFSVAFVLLLKPWGVLRSDLRFSSIYLTIQRQICTPAHQESLFSVSKQAIDRNRDSSEEWQEKKKKISALFYFVALLWNLSPDLSLSFSFPHFLSHSWLQEIRFERLMRSHELHIVLCSTRQQHFIPGLWPGWRGGLLQWCILYIAYIHIHANGSFALLTFIAQHAHTHSTHTHVYNCTRTHTHSGTFTTTHSV